MFREFFVAALGFLIFASASASEIEFSGYSWLIRDSHGALAGPGPNVFASTTNSVEVDAEGKLRLTIRKGETGWTSAEVSLPQALGYGTYELEVETNPAELDKQVVFGFFTYNSSPEQSHRELDVELSYWGRPEETRNSQFVVQPEVPGEANRFTINEANTLYRMRWTKGVAEFTALSADGQSLHHWVKREAVPDATGAKVLLNLWLAKGLPPQTGSNVAVVVKSFRFTPVRE